ncbi:MAG: FAD-binding domain-containing protein [Pseudomonadota bacterium]
MTDGVSQLSPYVQHRILPEWILLKEVLQRYSWDQIEKFIDEVVWRNYWRGWMEHNPHVWGNYLFILEKNKQEANNKDLQAAYSGETGIECFDDWVRKLYKTGYLHNHERMWFASIWIFTLNLPWHLGADFFLKLLLDGNECVNTLSWRWVAGLHTPGKHYLARAENIQRYTQGRYFPQGLLDESALSKVEDKILITSDHYPDNSILIFEDFLYDASDVKSNIGWIISSDDLSVIQKIKDNAQVKYILCLDASCVMQENNSPLVQNNILLKKNFVQELILEQKSKALCGSFHNLEMEIFSIQEFKIKKEFESETFANDYFQEKLVQLANDFMIDNWVVVMPPIGFASDFISENLVLNNRPVHFLKRRWDQDLSKFSNKGFFNFKKKISKESILDLIAISG